MIARFVANAAALALATWLIPGIVMQGGGYTQRAITLVIVAAVFGVLNSLVKPVFKFFTGCLILITLGLFVWVINACMLMLTSVICTHLGVPWHVTDWYAAFIGALLVAVVSWLLGFTLKDRS
ncbi:MAG: phage holin family protein [Propionibacterium sp.]|nr:phage holin family protein [Propionibacterium sp.]